MYVEIVYCWEDEESGGKTRMTTKTLEEWYDHNGFGFNTFMRSS